LRIILLFIIFGLTNSICLAQNSSDSTFQLLHEISIKSTCIIADNLQNIYIATEKGQVIKFDKNGNQQFEYNNNRLGEVGKIDVRNPLTILVYYPDLAVVVILDRTLAPIKELNLYDLAILEPKGVALANDNNIWVYDEVAALLKKVSQTGEILFESRNLNQLTRKNLSPSFVLEKNNLLYLSDLENGLFIFDNFGQLKQEIPIKGIARFQVVGQQLFLKKEGKYFQLFLDTLEKEIVELPKIETTIDDVFINGQLVYLIGKKTIKAFQYN